MANCGQYFVTLLAVCLRVVFGAFTSTLAHIEVLMFPEVCNVTFFRDAFINRRVC